MNNADRQHNPIDQKPPRPTIARSIKELASLAATPPIEPEIKIRLYFQSILTLYDRGLVCWGDGDLERAYVYFLKLATLYLEKLPKKHPRFNDLVESRKNLGLKDLDLTAIRSNARQKCNMALDNMEKIKPRLLEFYRSLPPPEVVNPKIKIENLHRHVQGHTGLDKSQLSNLRPKTQDELDQMVKYSPVVLPKKMLDDFLKIFEVNTHVGIESCGFFAGKFVNKSINQGRSHFLVTHLLIPEQTGTLSTCSSLDEEKIYTYQTEFELMPLGWIHTHPEYDCFLSSVDLHMQLGHQLILPEAIAIVMAPKREKDIGIFNLTKRGINILKNCSHGTDFHPHLENNLYEDAQHVQITEHSTDYKIVDLRKENYQL